MAGLIWGGKCASHGIIFLEERFCSNSIVGEIKGLGGYCEYTLADESICFKVPTKISPEQASTVPLAAATAWLALFSKDCLNIDRHGSNQDVLIWGGSCT